MPASSQTRNIWIVSTVATEKDKTPSHKTIHIERY